MPLISPLMPVPPLTKHIVKKTVLSRLVGV